MSKTSVVRVAALCIIILLLSALPSLCRVVYVSRSGDDTTADSWEHAKKGVQAGLDLSASGDEVWVAAGTYLELITLKSGVKLYGSFAGTEALLGDRDRAHVQVFLRRHSQGTSSTLHRDWTRLR
jgi:hypothetical protein